MVAKKAPAKKAPVKKAGPPARPAVKPAMPAKGPNINAATGFNMAARPAPLTKSSTGGQKPASVRGSGSQGKVNATKAVNAHAAYVQSIRQPGAKPAPAKKSGGSPLDALQNMFGGPSDTGYLNDRTVKNLTSGDYNVMKRMSGK